MTARVDTQRVNMRPTPSTMEAPKSDILNLEYSKLFEGYFSSFTIDKKPDSTLQNETALNVKREFEKLKSHTVNESYIDSAIILLNVLDNLPKPGTSEANWTLGEVDVNKLREDIENFSLIHSSNYFPNNFKEKPKELIKDAAQAKELYNKFYTSKLSQSPFSLSKITVDKLRNTFHEFNCKEIDTIISAFKNHNLESLAENNSSSVSSINYVFSLCDDFIQESENIIIKNHELIKTFTLLLEEHPDNDDFTQKILEFNHNIQINKQTIENLKYLINILEQIKDDNIPGFNLTNELSQEYIKILELVKQYSHDCSNTKRERPLHLGQAYINYLNYYSEKSPSVIPHRKDEKLENIVKLIKNTITSEYPMSHDTCYISLVELDVNHYEISSWLKNTEQLSELNKALKEENLPTIKLKEHHTFPKIQDNGHCLLSAIYKSKAELDYSAVRDGGVI
jgi:hypothetical protein